MEKRREPQTCFRWRKDAAGYVLSKDRKQIERRGGAMQEYDPSKIDRLHKRFADLFFWGFHPEGGNNPAPPNFNRDDAILGFVNEFGFLGSDRAGADAQEEPVAHFLKAQGEIAGFLHGGEAFGSAVLPHLPDGRFAGPALRMYLAPGNGGNLQVSYEPESLYAWLWLKVADELSSGIRWDGLPCLNCLSPMGRGPGGGFRQDARFCSGKCRVAFSRLSKAEQAKHKLAARNVQRANREAKL